MPYLLRHSRITSMLADETSESVIKLQMWGSLRSNMLSTYGHLGNADIDRILFSKAGIEVDGKMKDIGIKTPYCYKCGEKNLVGMKYCGACGTPLTEETRKLTADMASAINQDITSLPLAEQVKLMQEVMLNLQRAVLQKTP